MKKRCRAGVKRKQSRCARAIPPFVSVVMPVFNRPPYRLHRAVQSILNQTYPRFELIIADDISLSQRLEEQVRFLEQNPCVGLCSCQAERFGDVEPYITEFPENVDFITKNVDKVLFKSRENKTSIMERHPKLMARYLAKINLDAFDRLPRLRGILSFSEKVFEKKSFSAAYFKMPAFREFRETYRPAHALLRRIFSIRNKRSPDGRKTKVVTILSVDIVIKKL